MEIQEQAAKLLSEIRRLMTIKGENPFKIRAFENAYSVVLEQEDLVERARAGTLTELDGIGKGIAEVLTEFLLQGKSSVRDELIASIDPGVLELVRIPGLGPKKAQALVDELKIRTIGELEYACRENLVLGLKGFSEKSQEKIMEGISFLRASADQLKWVDARPMVESFAKTLSEGLGGARVEPTGEYRRRIEVLDLLSFLIETPVGKKEEFQEKASRELERFRRKTGLKIKVELFFSGGSSFALELFKKTGSEKHLESVAFGDDSKVEDENDLYRSKGLPWIAPELRETGEEVEIAKTGKLDEVLPLDAIQGVFHNHSTYSDGRSTLEDMIVEAKRLGLKYFGISEHSKSAAYARGMKLSELKEQETEVLKLREKHPEIRIFWGIESDILKDGSLDYSDSILEKFDFVIASVHTRFGMNKKEMTARVVKAIRNPYTRMLGHLTGRLLLGRPPFEVDMEKILDEAAKNDVAVEINCNPARLEIDWRWGPEIRKRKVLVSINPDAHEKSSIKDFEHGVYVARKALIPTASVVNTRTTEEVAAWLARQ